MKQYQNKANQKPGAGGRHLIMKYLCGGLWRRAGHRPVPGWAVPDDFIGICVAAGLDPASDDYIIARLCELGIRHVRLDLTYADAGDHQQRLLRKLTKQDFRVCLHLVQPRSEARLMPAWNCRWPESAAVAARERWRKFVDATLKQWGAAVECVEIGATCNRRKWSGQSLAAFLSVWQIAWHAARRHNVKIIGPNVTDFEPIYNLWLLDRLRRMGSPPDVHTDNLFVERAVEPELFDHKILGYKAAGLLKFNLIRKAQLLCEIGKAQDVPELYCTHTAWSLRRIARFLPHTEDKQADYLARYLLLAAVSGALLRVYWGPLIGQREGLIDDGTDEYPDPPHVTFYGQARGRVGDYRVRPAFHAMARVHSFLRDTTFTKSYAPGPELEILEFQAGSGEIRHAVWTVNARVARAADLYKPQALTEAVCLDRDGNRLAAPPVMFGEAPVYLAWPRLPSGGIMADNKTARIPMPGIRCVVGRNENNNLAVSNQDNRRGIHVVRTSTGQTVDPRRLTAMLAPPSPSGADVNCAHSMKNLETDKSPAVLRDGRNRVWRVTAPWAPEETLVVKQFQCPGYWRRLLNHGRPSKAVRSWNGAWELLRRRINTPAPLAFFTADTPDQPGFYICADFHPDCSVRDIFTALARGESAFRQRTADDWYNAIAGFLVNMHNRGVFFRDLSAGNLLLHDKTADLPPFFSLIDTARARFYPWPLPLGRRLADLKRICHPLHWRGRRRFMEIYMRCAGRVYHRGMDLPLILYDAKHVWKRTIKPLRRRV